MFTVLHVKSKRTLPDKKADRECEKAIEEFSKVAKQKIREWKQKGKKCRKKS